MEVIGMDWTPVWKIRSDSEFARLRVAFAKPRVRQRASLGFQTNLQPLEQAV
jgi:hypothetical protein